MDRIPYALSLGTLGFLGYFAVHSVDSVEVRLGEMERASADEIRQASALQRELARLNDELETLRAELCESRAELSRSEAVVSRLENIGREVELQNERLDRVTEAQASFDPAAIDANLRDLGRELTERWEAVYGVATSAAELAGESRQRLDALKEGRDPRARWHALMGPVVQLSGEDSVGSGVLVRGAVSADANEQVDYVLTAWHVVRDIQGSLYNRDMPVPVAIYLAEGQTRNETAALVEFDADIDIALLRLDLQDLNEHTVKLPTRSSLAGIQIFDGVYAVGCPLGNDPIPTLGQIAATHHEVDGESYMMINAPTYVGNSGGGIFNARTNELLGIFSKVYTHGSLRPTIVTHMGLVTPMSVVYAWLDSVGYGFLTPTSDLADASVANPREASAD
jgi:S1-C subfamily serine protease